MKASRQLLARVRSAHHHQHPPHGLPCTRALSISTSHDDESTASTSTTTTISPLDDVNSIASHHPHTTTTSGTTTTTSVGFTKYQARLLASHPASGPQQRMCVDLLGRRHGGHASFSTGAKGNDGKKKKKEKESGGGDGGGGGDDDDNGRPSMGTRFGKLGAIFDEVGKELKNNKDIQESLKELHKLKDEGMKPMTDKVNVRNFFFFFINMFMDSFSHFYFLSSVLIFVFGYHQKYL